MSNIDMKMFDQNEILKTTKIHLRLQRNGNHFITIIEGLDDNPNIESILKQFKKLFCCNGTIHNKKDKLAIIQLSGDQRNKVRDFLIKEGLSLAEDIIIHGY